VLCGTLAVVILATVQFQGTFRGVGYANANLSELSIVQSRGNTMFSEGLKAWQVIPDERPFFKNSFVCEGLIRPLPEQAFWFLIGPIPRAIWTTKPVDPLWEWYNQYFMGSNNGTVGTTISHGLVGSWYFNYGIFGCIEGAILVGWLMGVAERALQNSEGRPMGMLMSLAFGVWLFRLYRDFIFIDLYGLMIGGVMLTIFIYACRPFLGDVQSAASAMRAREAGLQYGGGYGAGYGV
jgi:hypothetical protein